MDDDRRQKEALWRYSILGPLVSAQLEHGDVRRLCEEAAERKHRKPHGQVVGLSPRTIEGWYYAYKKDGLEGLRPKGREDAGRSRAISPEVAEKIIALKKEKPRRSIRRIIKMLVRADIVDAGTLHKSTVHRLLKAHDISGRPRRTPKTERRAFRHPFAGDCWMGDVMHGPKVVDADGNERKTYLHAFLDSATRLICASAFRLGEKAADFESVFKAGVRKHGVPRMLYVDNGAAQTAESLRLISAELGVYLRHCAPYDAAAKGAIERFFKTYRAEVEDEFDPDETLTLDELNARLWAWLSAEYHRREHGGTEKVPLDHWLEHVDHLRGAPPADRLERIFLHRDTRVVRNDSTISFANYSLGVRGELVGQTVEVRFCADGPFDPEDRSTYPTVYVDGEPYCETVLVDPVRNSTRKRRQLGDDEPEDDAETDIDPMGQLLDEHARLKNDD